MNPENPILLRHLEQRGRAAYFQDKALVLADGARRIALTLLQYAGQRVATHR
ncbi:hypothetical protein [Massilia sp. TWP1-3-3]|uniref:hypothetical protein n=1 Tax=Massilia sp. TWP1-3-3 TaxID=2804573 RepID=UPI003CF55B64